MLAEVIRSQSDQPVFGLAFHVDYWNDLGWHDRFSDKRFSQRQYKYLRAWNQRRFYTPQMIVNGRHGFVGSKSRIAKQSIARALQTPTTAVVRVETETRATNELVVVTYKVVAAEQQLDLNLALVESGVQSPVANGENAGRTLEHSGVVRSFQVVSLEGGGSGQVQIEVPKDANLQHCRVIAYAQHSQSLEIVGAAQSEYLRN